MQINFKTTIILLALVSLSPLILAQNKQGKIATEEVNVVKTYTPTISESSKIKEVPFIDDEQTKPREAVKYGVVPFPVASTFSPSKGTAQDIEKNAIGRLFKNYATLGAGNYGTMNAELFTIKNLNKDNYIGGIFRHLSSQGGINGVELKNSFYDTSFDITYSEEKKEIPWVLDLKYQNRIYNWYGLPADFGNKLSSSSRNTLISGINPKQVYNSLLLDSKVDFRGELLEASDFGISYFSDAFGSAENRFYIKPSFKLLDKNIKVNATLDYLKSSFNQSTIGLDSQPITYSYATFGLAPNYEFQRYNWSIKIGTNLVYNSDSQGKTGGLFIYPDIYGSHKIVGDFMILYAGLEGNLKQNSYQKFVDENPYVSPTLNIAPTNKKIDLFSGLKGKLADNISYNIKVSYTNEANKALFRSNNYSTNTTNKAYAFGNSLQVVYDEVKTLRFSGEIKANISKDFIVGLNGAFANYNSSTEKEAWNLPTVRINANLDYAINPKWDMGANITYVGSRRDFQINLDSSNTPSPITIDSYIDLNANAVFKYSNRLSAFLRANNIANQAYQRWLNYTVQGFQVLLGANYKFDF